MNLIQFRYVKSVVLAGSFSMAARDCGVSQPTISNAISDLEEELGGKIFRRTTRSVELTPFGAGIMPYVESILVLVENIEQEAEARLRPERKVLRVAFSPIIDGPRLMHDFDGFQKLRPDIAFMYKECGVEELEARLDQEKIDVICGIRLQDRPTLGRCLLYWDVLRFLPNGGTTSPLAMRDTISLQDISPESLIFTVDTCGLAPAVRDFFRRNRLKLNEYAGHPLSYHVVQEWTGEGIGAAILPESRITGDPSVYPVVVSGGRPVTLAIEAVWVRGNAAPDHVKAFVDFLQESSREANTHSRRNTKRQDEQHSAVASYFN